MLFYCPNCRKEVEVEPSGTVTTKSGRVAYKASCPTCNQDMSEFATEQNKPKATTETTIGTETNQDAVAESGQTSGEKTSEPENEGVEPQTTGPMTNDSAQTQPEEKTVEEPATISDEGATQLPQGVQADPDQTVQAYITNPDETESSTSTAPGPGKVIQASVQDSTEVNESDAQAALNQAAQQVGKVSIEPEKPTLGGPKTSVPERKGSIPQDEPVKIAGNGNFSEFSIDSKHD